MTYPDLPKKKSEDWYPWVQGLDGEVRLSSDTLATILNRLDVLESGKAVPSPPTNLTVTLDGNSADFDWDAPTNAGSSAVTGYYYGRDGNDINGSGPWTSQLLPVTQSAGPLLNLAWSTTYEAFVQAVNDAGPGPKATIIITTPADPGAVVVPPITGPTDPNEDPIVNNLVNATVASAEGSDLSPYLDHGKGFTKSFDTAWSDTGSQSLRITANTGASSDAGVYVNVPVTAGKRYRVRHSIRRGAGGELLLSAVKFRSTTGQLNEVKTATITRSVDFTTRQDFRVTAPPGSVTLSFVARYDAVPAAGSFFWLDSISVEEVTPEAGLSKIISNQIPASMIFPATSEWRKDISAAPLHEQSAAIIQYFLDNEVTPYYNGVTAYNVNQFNSTFYVVADDHPVQNVGFFDSQSKAYTPGELYANGGLKAFRDVPIPVGAVAGGGSDGHIMIYRPSTDQLWEFWKFQENRQQKIIGGVSPANAAIGNYTYQPAGTLDPYQRGFSAAWGGRIDNVSTGDGAFPGATGTSATGLSYATGNVSIVEAQNGVINHALALTLVHPRSKVYSYPAKRTDGYRDNVLAIPEGLRLRLDPTLNVDAISGLHPLAKQVAKAAQKYGFIVGDKGGVVEVEGENSEPLVRLGQLDPWGALRNGTAASSIMKNFPWASLQALPFDYGKP